MTSPDQYRDLVAHALAGFQLVEASLKDYISDYHDKVRSCLPPGMVYDYHRSDIQDAALGKLVEVFNKTNRNKELVGSLRKLQASRDNLAHRALTKLYGRRTPAEEQELREQAPGFVALAEQLSELLGNVHNEHVLLVGKPVGKARTAA
jgi:hypothetical protein